MKKIVIGTFAALTMMTMLPTETSARSNPLLEPSQAPHASVPFDKIEYSDYEDAIKAAMENQNAEINSIVRQRSLPDFENTIVALERSNEQLRNVCLTLSNLEAALGDTTLQNITAKVTPLLSKHTTDIMLNKPLFERVKQVYDDQAKFNLSGEQKMLLDKIYRQFVNSGALLSEADREKYRRLSAELSDLQVKFSQNVSNEMKNPDRRLWLTLEETEGIPESVLAAARAEAAEVLMEEGKNDDGSLYLFTVFFPSYSPVMKYAKNRDVRERMHKLYNSRNVGGEFDNMQVLKDIANVRMEIANLFGKKNFAEYELEDKMAKNVETVNSFLNDLNQAYTPAMQKELKEIEDYARKSEGDDFKLMAWDYSYWADKLKSDKYNFNDEDLKPYFELNNTVKGVFGLATKLYGYNFTENKDIPVYHPDVTAYDVTDADGKFLGVFYTDFFYRPGKYPGAWMTNFREESYNEAGEKVYPLVSIVCNFTKPTGNEPVLLNPYEVETFLHEFGHSLHGLSADTKYAETSGTNVAHDFVELFSQFNENYLTEKKWLDTFAKHYKTGKKIPASLLNNFIESSRFGAAYACLRQLNFGYLDMAYHTIEEPIRASASIAEFEDNALKPVKLFDAVDGCYISPAFGHIFGGGYAAGYYGYKWAELLDADAFAAFQENGIFNKKTADKFRKMLRSGGTVDAMDLYLEFRGKQPSVDALLKRDGIKK